MSNGVQNEENTWAMLCHLSAFAGFIGVPLGNLIGPLIVWLVKKDQFPLVDQNGKESLNFQISLTIYAIVAGILTLVFIGFILLAVLYIAGIIYVILASIAANKGEVYRYPMTIRFIQ